MSFVIKGDKVIFKNMHTDQNIILKHNSIGYDLIFDSECVFKMTTEHKVLKLGDFSIELSNESDALQVKKNGQTLFKIIE